VPAEGGVTLGRVASHLLLPKSSASVLVKDLERRGFVRRRRDSSDERRLAIVLTAKGRRRVEADTVLEPGALAAALGELPERERRALVRALARLAEAAEARSGARGR
jgi:DNA-binding MarR family transcriptional regulator